MNTENAVLLTEWDGIRKGVLRGLKNLGHDIEITRYPEKEPIKEEITFKTGDVVRWNVGGNKPEEKGIILCIIPAGESVIEKLPKETKKCHMHFKDISMYDRALVAVSAKNFKQETNYYAPRMNALKKRNGG